MSSALFIGRFQPFHKGHLEVVQKIIKENDYLYIGIGSAEANNLPANPFTSGERFQLIQNALDEAKIPRQKYSIIPINNINNYALWVHHVQLHLPPFQKIYTGSEVVKYLYEQANLNLKNPYKIITIKLNPKYSATKIRELILKNKKWEHLIPVSTAKILNDLQATKRLNRIQKSEK